MNIALTPCLIDYDFKLEKWVELMGLKMRKI